MSNKDVKVVTITDFDETQFDVTNVDQSNKIRLSDAYTSNISLPTVNIISLDGSIIGKAIKPDNKSGDIQCLLPDNLGKGLALDTDKGKYNVNLNPDNLIFTQTGEITTTVNLKALAQRVETLETLEYTNICKASIAEVNDITITKNSADVIVCDGGVIKFHSDIEVGQQFTIIQGSNNSVTISTDNGYNVVPPLNGSLVLSGRNAVVSVLKTNQDTLRVFGETK